MSSSRLPTVVRTPSVVEASSPTLTGAGLIPKAADSDSASNPSGETPRRLQSADGNDTRK